ncbi:MAG TPA: DUF3307 domain-containing protein [Candidatus Limnocylindrales bacterium]|nr:DUF3307 domain-containing protein [Candidatus Limnocylindrales bacterium]
MTDVVLVLAWLVLAHFVADFVLQTGDIAAAKADRGSRALGGLLAHGLIVALCLVPIGLAFEARGWTLVAVSAITHVLIDRAKVVLTRRAASSALRAANARREGPQPPDHLGRAWTAGPAALFVADQLAHLLVAGGAWAVLLAGVAPSSGWTAAIDGALGGWDRTTVHHVVGVLVVLAALLIVNVRAASLFVSVLVRPVEAGLDGGHRWGGRAGPAIPAATLVSAPAPGAARRWSVRLGPLEAQVAAEAEPSVVAASATGGGDAGQVALTARVGSTIGILERLLICVFILTGSDVAVGFVVAAKTLARFKQLDDREFAEYYLLGTLASVAVAIISALLARSALGVLLG